MTAKETVTQFDKHPLVVFGEDWDSHPSSTQHLARELSKFHDITWINSIGLRAPAFTVNDISRVVKKCRAMLTPSRAIQQAECSIANKDPLDRQCPKDWMPQIINPIALPFHGHSWARWFNEKLIKQRLFKANQGLAIQKPMLWLSLPSAVPLLGKINECFSIYYCGDDFSALEGVDHDVIAELEQELVEKVDLIVVASETLSEKFPAEKTLFIPHGVADYFFEAPDQRPEDLPDGPVAGFYGSISSWFDQQLLVETARRLPHWNFAIIGPQRCDVSEMEACDNIHFLGEKDHHQLPNYVHHWQVSLLPFKNNAQIQACNPLKLREYMAVGKPIVSTDFPALEPYRNWLSVADADSFAREIEQAAADLPAVVGKAGLSLFDVIGDWRDIDRMRCHTARRIQQVSDQSWQARAMRIEREIQRRMGGEVCPLLQPQA